MAVVITFVTLPEVQFYNQTLGVCPGFLQHSPVTRHLIAVVQVLVTHFAHPPPPQLQLNNSRCEQL